jgi:hypothetical protein
MRDYLRRAISSAPVDVALMRANVRPQTTDLELRPARDDSWTAPGRNGFSEQVRTFSPFSADVLLLTTGSVRGLLQNLEIKVDTAIHYD